MYEEDKNMSTTDAIRKGIVEFDDDLQKAVYVDNAQNRALKRVGMQYTRSKSGTQVPQPQTQPRTKKAVAMETAQRLAQRVGNDLEATDLAHDIAYDVLTANRAPKSYEVPVLQKLIEYSKQNDEVADQVGIMKTLMTNEERQKIDVWNDRLYNNSDSVRLDLFAERNAGNGSEYYNQAVESLFQREYNQLLVDGYNKSIKDGDIKAANNWADDIIESVVYSSGHVASPEEKAAIKDYMSRESDNLDSCQYFDCLAVFIDNPKERQRFNNYSYTYENELEGWWDDGFGSRDNLREMEFFQDDLGRDCKNEKYSEDYRNACEIMFHKTFDEYGSANWELADREELEETERWLRSNPW